MSFVWAWIVCGLTPYPITYLGLQFPPYAPHSTIWSKIACALRWLLSLVRKGYKHHTPKPRAGSFAILTQTLKALCSVFASFPWLLFTDTSVLHFSLYLIVSHFSLCCVCALFNPSSLESYKCSCTQCSVKLPFLSCQQCLQCLACHFWVLLPPGAAFFYRYDFVHILSYFTLTATLWSQLNVSFSIQEMGNQ